MKIFIDVDNTIVEHYGFYSPTTEARVHTAISKHPVENQSAIEYMYESSICHDPDIIRELFLKQDVYILTKYNSQSYENEKKKRLSKIFNMSVHELETIRDCDNNLKYIAVEQNESKVDVVKKTLGVENIDGFILIDDFSQNIIEWESKGGLGIKFFNQYNSPQHPTNGLSISNFKIFDMYLEKYKLNNLLIVGKNKYKLKEVVSRFDELVKFKHIDFLKIVYNDLADKIGFESFSEHSKYSHLNFLIEYYNFINNVNSKYWDDKINLFLSDNNLNVVSSSFEPSITGFKSRESLTMKVNGTDDGGINNIYDVYVTLNEERFIDDIEKIYNSLLIIFKVIIKL